MTARPSHRAQVRCGVLFLGLPSLLGCGGSEPLDPRPPTSDGWYLPVLEELDPTDRPSLLLPLPEGGLAESREGAKRGVEPDEFAYFRRTVSLPQTWKWPEHPSGEFVRSFGLLGIRLVSPVPQVRPDPLWLLTGDSHVDGVVDDSEVMGALIQDQLRSSDVAEQAYVINAACGFYSFPNYLGIATRFLRLEPDVFVLVVYGGNDFGALLPMQAELEGRPRPMRPPGYRERIQAALKLTFEDREGGPSLWQGFNQLVAFAANPESVDPTLELALDYTRAIAELADEAGTRLLVAYLPPAHDVEQSQLHAIHTAVADALELDAEALAATDRLADRYLRRLAALSIESVDLRPAFLASDAPLYWIADEHINIEGHRLLAEVVLEAVERR
ncbi:MAG: SGNH/GDSL hydrolase family protein [Planctomycetota bacterium]